MDDVDDMYCVITKSSIETANATIALARMAGCEQRYQHQPKRLQRRGAEILGGLLKPVGIDESRPMVITMTSGRMNVTWPTTWPDVPSEMIGRFTFVTRKNSGKCQHELGHDQRHRSPGTTPAAR